MASNIGDNYDLHLQAPAKINLVLRVLARRPDGYHELETWMQKVGLYDSLYVSVTDTPEIRLSCSQSELPIDASNLVWRAAELFFSESSRAEGKGANIHLDKRIPVAAGLGGGSSDAGTLLRGLNSYFGGEIGEERMIRLAKSLGADVPFFVVEAQSVIATGIGELMLPVAAPASVAYVLVNPGFSVSTATIFEKFALTRVEKNSTLTGSRKLRPEELNISALENDLEAVTMAIFPVIADIKNELREAGAEHVLMSGSGPTVFGAFTGSTGRRDEIIKSAVIRLRQKFGDRVYIAG